MEVYISLPTTRDVAAEEALSRRNFLRSSSKTVQRFIRQIVRLMLSGSYILYSVNSGGLSSALYLYNKHFSQ